MMEEQIEHPMIEQKESIKLIKGAKGYRWEIKILSTAELGIGNELPRLMIVDEAMKRKYGVELE